ISLEDGQPRGGKWLRTEAMTASGLESEHGQSIGHNIPRFCVGGGTSQALIDLDESADQGQTRPKRRETNDPPSADPAAGPAFGLAPGGRDAGSQADGAVAAVLAGRNVCEGGGEGNVIGVVTLRLLLRSDVQDLVATSTRSGDYFDRQNP